MSKRIAINGFGRIGRGVFRAWLQRGASASGVEMVAVNDLAPIETLVHLLNHDSVYGRLEPTATVEDDSIVVGDARIRVTTNPDPGTLPWETLGVDTVVESTGRFTEAEAARAHVRAGAKRVLISAPGKGTDVTLVVGVNDDAYDPASHTVISNGSCTTNALAPIARVLHDVATIEHGFVTTVHAYTQDQMLIDGPHRDLRRARAAGLNIIPTSTGAAKAIGRVIPELDGRLAGDALRVPVPVGSIVELNALVEREASVDDLIAAFDAAAKERMAGILRVSHDPIVSSDVVGDTASAIVDAPLLRATGRHVKVVAWYDNEAAFSHRMLDVLARL